VRLLITSIQPEPNSRTLQENSGSIPLLHLLRLKLIQWLTISEKAKPLYDLIIDNARQIQDSAALRRSYYPAHDQGGAGMGTIGFRGAVRTSRSRYSKTAGRR
jgi:hypothetical protein